MKKRKQKNSIGNIDEYIKINRKLSREEEIAKYGRPIRIFGIHKSKKIYDRKRMKKELSGESSFFLCLWLNFYDVLVIYYVENTNWHEKNIFKD